MEKEEEEEDSQKYTFRTGTMKPLFSQRDHKR